MLLTILFILFASGLFLYIKGILFEQHGPKYKFRAQQKKSLKSERNLENFPESASKTTLAFVGDLMFARSIEKKMKEKGDYTYILGKVEPKLKEYDLLFGNLESVISNKGRDIGSKFSFRAPPNSIETLKQAQFDIVSVANNHSADWTGSAFLDSIERLKRAGISACGGGENKKRAYEPKVVSANGFKVGFICATNLGPKLFKAEANSAGFVRANKHRVAQEIKKTKEKKRLDLIVVSLHFGQEYKQQPSDKQVDLAQGLIDAGADIVVGHHPHVTQPVKTYKDGVIAYSLGNFVFDQLFSEETRNSFILKVYLDHRGEISGFEKKKIRINKNYRPEFIDNESSK